MFLVTNYVKYLYRSWLVMVKQIPFLLDTGTNEKMFS